MRRQTPTASAHMILKRMHLATSSPACASITPAARHTAVLLPADHRPAAAPAAARTSPLAAHRQQQQQPWQQQVVPACNPLRRHHRVVVVLAGGQSSSSRKARAPTTSSGGGRGFGVPAKTPSSQKAASKCPCGSGKPYSGCCSRYHSGNAAAPSPEALLRARFSAYAMQLVDYIVDTTHPQAR